LIDDGLDVVGHGSSAFLSQRAGCAMIDDSHAGCSVQLEWLGPSTCLPHMGGPLLDSVYFFFRRV